MRCAHFRPAACLFLPADAGREGVAEALHPGEFGQGIGLLAVLALARRARMTA